MSSTLNRSASGKPEDIGSDDEAIRNLTRTATEKDDDEERAYNTMSRVPTSREDEMLTRYLSGRQTVFSTTLPEMGDNKPYPASLPERQPYRVEFTGPDDSLSPLNWPMKRKFIVGAVLSFMTMNVTFQSSIYGSTTASIEKVFHVGVSPAELGTTLFVLGFALGPCVWGPLSEYTGRRIPLIVSAFLTLCFAFAAATAKDIQTLMISRFFGGCSGSASLTIVPGAFADVYTSTQRGKATSIYALCVSGGPMLGPVIGAFVNDSYLHWRWCLYLSGILSAVSLVLVTLFYEETYHPIILARKARELRERTGIWGIYAQHETLSLDVVELLSKSTIRPVAMLFQEPILFLISLYGGFVYGLLYMSLSVIPYMFETKYGWHTGVLGLPYVSLLLGCVATTICSIFIFEPRYRKAQIRTGLPVVPEERLGLMMMAAPLYTIGIFWMFWTGAYPKTAEHPHGCHFMVPIVGGSLFGFGFLGIFMPMINYVIDSYLMLAASGMAANTFLRSILGAAFPLFAIQMFKNLGIQWAGTLIGCLSLIMIPIPFLFYKYGARIRRKSKFAIDLSQVTKEEEEEEGETLSKHSSDPSGRSTGNETR